MEPKLPVYTGRVGTVRVSGSLVILQDKFGTDEPEVPDKVVAGSALLLGSRLGWGSGVADPRVVVVQLQGHENGNGAIRDAVPLGKDKPLDVMGLSMEGGKAALPLPLSHDCKCHPFWGNVPGQMALRHSYQEDQVGHWSMFDHIQLLVWDSLSALRVIER